jgi:ribosomal-protein-alanine N-acetyltransferase
MSTVALQPLRWWHLEEAAALDAELFGPTAWSPETFWSELARPQTRRYLAALTGTGRLVGYAGLMLSRGQGDVQTLAVAPSMRGRGVGARLLGELLRRAEEGGATSVMLEVHADNAGAIALYAGFGFEPIARRRGYYQPAGGDAVIMRRRPGGRGVGAGMDEDG